MTGIRRMSTDKPRFGRKSAPAKGVTAPVEDDDLEEIKSAVLAKLALDLGKDASVATDRDWFVAASLTIPPSHQGRLATGIPRGMAVLRQSMGVRAARGDLRHPLRRLGRDDDFADRRQTLNLALNRDP